MTLLLIRRLARRSRDDDFDTDNEFDCEKDEPQRRSPRLLDRSEKLEGEVERKSTEERIEPNAEGRTKTDTEERTEPELPLSADAPTGGVILINQLGLDARCRLVRINR